MRHTEIDPLYSKLIRSVLKDGKEVASPRGMPVKELYNVGFCLEDARNSIILNPYRKMHYAYAAIEMLGLFRHGDKNVDPYCWYNKNMKQFLNPQTGTWDGSYATRLDIYEQLPHMYTILKSDPDSRRAVISFYNPAHDFHTYESKDVCCTLSLVFRLRNGKLNLTCTMRSNDILLGLPYDLTQFTFLQSVLATWLGVEMGEYYHFTANLHAYQHDFPKLDKIANKPWPREFMPPAWSQMPKWDMASKIETYEQIDKLFEMDFYYRNVDLELAAHAGQQLSSEVLKTLYKETLQPYVNKKLEPKA